MNLKDFKAYIDSFDEYCKIKNLDSEKVPVRILIVNAVTNQPVTVDFNSVAFKNNEICIM